MSLSDQTKPLSYLETNAAEIVRMLAEKREPLVITQDGEAKLVVQDIDSYEEMQETLAYLKVIAQAKEDIAAGRTSPADDVFWRIEGGHD